MNHTFQNETFLGSSNTNQSSGLPNLSLHGSCEKNPECPVCDPVLNTLAHHLPFAHCSHSRLVCHMSGAALNENNQPMMLPNGKGWWWWCFFFLLVQTFEMDSCEFSEDSQTL